jgi:hypothetical protein
MPLAAVYLVWRAIRTPDAPRRIRAAAVGMAITLLVVSVPVAVLFVRAARTVATVSEQMHRGCDLEGCDQD